jgi:ATP-dependent Lhr-like helicase
VKISVYKLPQRKKIGGIEEGFLERLRPRDIFVLGGKLYRFRFARGMRCFVEDVPKEAMPTIPAWFSELLPLSFDLAMEIQKFRTNLKRKFEKGEGREEIISWLLGNFPVDKNSANSIYEYFKEHYLYTDGKIPDTNKILIERTYDLEGRKFLVFHSLFGRRTNDALSRAVAILLAEQIEHSVGVIVSDNGFALLIPKKRRPKIERLIQDLSNCNLEELLRKSIRKTELMKRRFRHCAARSFLVLRNYKGYKISVSKQQTSSQTLLRVCEEVDENFPVIQETYREILEDTLDIDRAKEVIDWLKKGKIKTEVISTEVPSPFAHNLIVLGEADIILMEDRKKRLLDLHEAIMRRIGGK